MREDLDFLRRYKPTLIGLREAKKAAVCIPMIGTEDGWDILFEVRASDIGIQPGDICFPGGHLKEGEGTWEAAVREIREELLIQNDQIEQIGLMDVFGAGGANLYVYPYAVLLKGYENTFSSQEVEKVFRVPLSWFCNNDPEVYYTSMKIEPQEGFPYERIHGGRDYNWRERREDVLFYQYKEYTIWGMTAKIIHSFVEIYKKM